MNQVVSEEQDQISMPAAETSASIPPDMISHSDSALLSSDPIPTSLPPATSISPSQSGPRMTEIQNIALHAQPPTQPPSTRAGPPTSDRKRTSPFQFGTRFLEASDDVFAWNAWDHVDPSTDELFVAYAQQQYAFQKENAASPDEADRYRAQPAKMWDRFYRRNAANFFKDRKWLRQEFPVLGAVLQQTSGDVEQSSKSRTTELQNDDLETPQKVLTDSSDGPEKLLNASHDPGEEARRLYEMEALEYQSRGPWNRLLEIGAGAGNTAFPLLRVNRNPSLHLHAADFSHQSVKILQSTAAEHSQSYQGTFTASQWDLAAPNALPDGVAPGSVDAILLIFTLSALAPEQWPAALSNIFRALRPGGEVCFRDYGRGDLAQVRFRKGRWLGDNFYARGDGTRVYFFDEDELRRIWGGFAVEAAREAQTSPDLSSDHPKAHFASIASESVTSPKIEGAESSDALADTEEQASREQSQVSQVNGDKDSEPSPRFEIVRLGVDRRLLVNRKAQLKMYRCWMQGIFRKPYNIDGADSKD